jgi:glutaredoxin
MEYPLPKKGQFTIYSKSGCNNCSKIKSLLKEKNILFNVIDCDDFILDNKSDFLRFIQDVIGKEHKIFPIIFDNEQFIGSYNETLKFIDKLLDFQESF